MMKTPIFALVGKPNVGKSTLFNTLTGSSGAITSPVPGTTRDWLEAPMRTAGRRILLADTCGYGLRDDIGKAMDTSVRDLLGQCAGAILVVNPGMPPDDEERRLARLLKKGNLRIITACNKCDSPRDDVFAWTHARLGTGNPVPVSAINRRNISELSSRIEAAAAMAGGKGIPDIESAEATCVIIGQPNVGKSTLFNALIGENRSLVHDDPGTTRDPVHVRREVGGMVWELVDTAGVGRRWRGSETIYRDAQGRSLKSLRKSDIAVLVLDLGVPLVRQDLRFASVCILEGLGLAVVLNKADLLEPSELENLLEKAASYLHGRFPSVGRYPVLVCSSITGDGVPDVREAIRELYRLRNIRIPPATLAEAVFSWPSSGRAWVIQQADESPPRFVVTPPERGRPSSRFVINRLRNSFGLHGIPIYITWKGTRS